MLNSASPELPLFLPPPRGFWQDFSPRKIFLKLLFLGGLVFVGIFLPLLLGKSFTAVFSWKYLFVFLWLGYVWLLNLSGSATLLLGIVLLLGLPLVLSFKAEPLAEPLSILAFILLTLGVFQQLVELLGEDASDEPF